MAKMDIDVYGTERTVAGMRASRAAVEIAVGDGQEKFAEEMKKEVQKTAPVDTGDYRDDWEVKEKKGTWYLVNTMPYAKHLVFPNSNFVGSTKADDPGRGILHNVRGIVHSRKTRYKAVITSKVKTALF